MNAKVLLLLAVVAAAFADKPSPSYNVPDSDSRSYEDSFEVPKYEFQWSVDDSSSGNNFGHEEARDDEHTQGGFYVDLADGRRQNVKYVVDGDSGFLAEVTYDGEARYSSESRSGESREYAPPRPTYA
ncbi:pro-resilin-like [Portunus trituberculatus]|uniref:pro-resilin-like n=1 Tax=Portunus trituberculatus TaxID=210409 RepID=UPI001E1D1BFB|nr:pro-resilin-like [Portunus trituberculatus]